MCCLIAAPFNPSCTPGDVYLVFLSSYMLKKKRITSLLAKASVVEINIYNIANSNNLLKASDVSFSEFANAAFSMSSLTQTRLPPLLSCTGWF